MRAVRHTWGVLGEGLGVLWLYTGIVIVGLGERLPSLFLMRTVKLHHTCVYACLSQGAARLHPQRCSISRAVWKAPVLSPNSKYRCLHKWLHVRTHARTGGARACAQTHRTTRVHAHGRTHLRTCTHARAHACRSTC